MPRGPEGLDRVRQSVPPSMNLRPTFVVQTTPFLGPAMVRPPWLGGILLLPGASAEEDAGSGPLSLRLPLPDPLLDRRGAIAGEAVEEACGVVADDQHRAVRFLHEPLRHRVVEEGDEPVEVAGDVQEAARLGVEAELRPRPCLEDLLERPDRKSVV